MLPLKTVKPLSFAEILKQAKAARKRAEEAKLKEHQLRVKREKYDTKTRPDNKKHKSKWTKVDPNVRIKGMYGVDWSIPFSKNSKFRIRIESPGKDEIDVVDLRFFNHNYPSGKYGVDIPLDDKWDKFYEYMCRINEKKLKMDMKRQKK